jgi:ubiquitin-conjugating enzyme E2 variant
VRDRYDRAMIIIALFATATIALEAFVCLLIADFLAGLLHWAEDTWLAPGASPLLDKWVVLPNIDHHRRPGAIREGSYWVNNQVSIFLAAVPLLLLVGLNVHAWEPYLVILLASQSNQFHMWAHCANPPALVKLLQNSGLLQRAALHAVHHKRPYGVRYCTTTSYLNPILDRIDFWRGLERIAVRLGATVYRATPVRQGY